MHKAQDYDRLFVCMTDVAGTRFTTFQQGELWETCRHASSRTTHCLLRFKVVIKKLWVPLYIHAYGLVFVGVVVCDCVEIGVDWFLC